MDITTVNDLLTALHNYTPTITLSGAAAKLVSSVLVLRNKTYSPFMQMAGAIQGVLGDLLNHDFSGKVGGDQAGTRVQLSTAQQQQFGITPDNAVYLVNEINDHYSLKQAGATFTLTHNTKTHTSKPNAMADKYSKYLN